MDNTRPPGGGKQNQSKGYGGYQPGPMSYGTSFNPNQQPFNQMS